MKLNLEKLMLMLVLLSLILTFTGLSVTRGGFLTEDEAIEISWNSSTVQNLLEDSTSFRLIQVQYLNASVVESWKEYNPERWARFPQGWGVWEIVWSISLKPHGYDTAMVTHFIDEHTGEILLEGILNLE